jgi:hypothetical protein
MTTRKQSAANSRNAKKSTGPRTVPGKRTSSRNAVKHGMFSAEVIALYENSEHFRARVECLVRELNPLGSLEYRVVGDIALSEFRLDRGANYEAHLLNDALMRDFFRNLGCDLKGMDPDEVERRFQEYRMMPREYDLDIDKQIKIVNNTSRIHALLDRLFERLERLQSRPIELRSRGERMDPSSPLAQSMADHDEMERMHEFEEEERRSRLQTRLRLLQGKPIWEDENETTSADPNAWGNANDDIRDASLEQTARDEPDVGG